MCDVCFLHKKSTMQKNTVESKSNANQTCFLLYQKSKKGAIEKWLKGLF